MTAGEAMSLSGRLFPDGGPARVRVEGGVIRAVEPAGALDEPSDGQRWLVPGFFDLQVNGFAGRSFSGPDLSVEAVEAVARAMLATGVTRFLPTVVTADLEAMARRLAVLAEAMDRSPLVSAMCPGIHLEGPFIHPEDGPRGAHRRAYVRDPDVGDFERLRAAARGRIAMLTLAPERPGGIELIRHASARGAVVALGHHRADADALDRAVAAGARVCTHLGNGADALLPRHAGNYIWQQLGDDRLWATFIADGHHLPPAVLRSMLRAKGLERSILVTDTTDLAGQPPGRYDHHGLEVELTPDGRIVIPGTSYLAGSAADVPLLIGRAVADAGLTFPQAVALVTLQPETLMGGHGPAWPCSPGRPANLVELLWRPQTAAVQVARAVIGAFMHAAEA
ncbi:MAG: amidohydrolase family protein [Phycisphaerae bacterium]|jgi:N-acetylglucosamine-6-phosphate deacetylase